jgi:hypothetical protein
MVRFAAAVKGNNGKWKGKRSAFVVATSSAELF